MFALPSQPLLVNIGGGHSSGVNVRRRDLRHMTYALAFCGSGDDLLHVAARLQALDDDAVADVEVQFALCALSFEGSEARLAIEQRLCSSVSEDLISDAACCKDSMIALSSQPAAYVLFSRSLGPYFQRRKGAGMPRPMPMNASREFPQSSPSALYM